MDQDHKYVDLGLMARGVQGRSPVIAIGGGKIAVSQAAVETVMPHGPGVKWTIFPAQRTRSGVVTKEEVNSTVMDFANHPMTQNNANIVRKYITKTLPQL